jgi:hypothetical protein
VRFGEESKENRGASEYQLYDLKNHYGYILDLQMALTNESFFAKRLMKKTICAQKLGRPFRRNFRRLLRLSRLGVTKL